MKKIKNILLIYKRSVYEVYFLNRSSSLYEKRSHIKRDDIARLRCSHKKHYKSLAEVERVLRVLDLPFTRRSRGKMPAEFNSYDCIITVGGDGTFLDSAKNVSSQIIIGVNSDPKRSVGRLCTAIGKTFKTVISGVIGEKIKPKKYCRLRFKAPRKDKYVYVANDLLICHNSPAALSRYVLTINKRSEVHRSSGLWVATASGSSGAVKSAGGKELSPTDKRIQYMPRELYRYQGINYNMNGGLLFARTSIKIRSLMRKGVIYVDGAHQKYPFIMGDTITICRSSKPLNIIKI